MIPLIEHAPALIALANFIMTVAVAVLGLYVKTQVSDAKIELREAISEAGQEIDDRLESLRREVGETIAAVRAKVTELELYVRDTYVRRDSFFKVSDDLKDSVRAEIGKVEKRLEVIESVLRDRRQ